MGKGKTGAFHQGCLPFWAGNLLVLMGLIILGQGCTEVDQFVRESQGEHRLVEQLERAEDDLKRGNLLAARTLFERVYRESKSPRVREEALFFSGFTILLDKRDKDRLERGQKVFSRVSEAFPEGEFGQISTYVAEAISDALVTVGALKKDNALMGQTVDLERARSRELDLLVQKQKKKLAEESEKTGALKNSIRLKNEEIESLKLKIEKLEEIHKEIKKKRQSLS